MTFLCVCVYGYHNPLIYQENYQSNKLIVHFFLNIEYFVLLFRNSFLINKFDQKELTYRLWKQQQQQNFWSKQNIHTHTVAIYNWPTTTITTTKNRRRFYRMFIIHNDDDNDDDVDNGFNVCYDHYHSFVIILYLTKYNEKRDWLMVCMCVCVCPEAMSFFSGI